MTTLPSPSEVLDWIDELKNWGRWGPDDQRGTLNLIEPEHRVAAARLVTEGRTVSCARDLITAYGHPDNCAQMYYVASGEGARCREESVPPTALGYGDLGSAVEFFGPVFHGINVTHIDASSVSGGSTEYADAHDHARWGQVAGWHQACLPWLRDRDVAVIGGDGPQETIPPVYPEALGTSVHVYALNSMGMPLIDNCDLEALSATCRELGRWEFQFIISPIAVF